jgi:hypothetical protein
MVAGNPCWIDRLYENHGREVFRTAIPAQSDFLFCCYPNPFLPVGAWFGFVAPPIGYYLFVAGTVVAYLALVEMVKTAFYRGRIGWVRNTAFRDRS